MRYANPAFVFATVWGTVLILDSMRLLSVLVPINITSVLLVTTNIILFYVILAILRDLNFAGYKRYRKKRVILADQELSALSSYARCLFPLWLLGTLINILYSGGVPLYWMITGSNLNYANFGVPTFRGLIMAINAFLAVSYFIIYLKRPKFRTLCLFIIQLSWPIVVISRGNFTYILLEVAGVYLLLKKSNIKTLIVLLLGFFLFVYLFGLIGDYRMGLDKVESYRKSIINPDYFAYTSFLPSGILYVYSYVTTPFNNIVYNINSLNPNFVPFHSIMFLFPTIVRNFIYSGHSESSFRLVTEAFNASTFYVGYLMDFGVILTIMIVSAWQFCAAILYYRALKGNIAYLIAYSVVFQCIALSIFSDNFTLLMSIFQIALAFIFGQFYKRRYYNYCFTAIIRISDSARSASKWSWGE